MPPDQPSNLRVRQAYAICVALRKFIVLFIMNILMKCGVKKKIAGKDMNVSFKTFTGVLDSAMLEAGRIANKGGKAPNNKIHCLEDPNKEMKLLDFHNKNRALVLNFGSST